MTTIEDRLRAAVRAAADTVADGSAPPLQLQLQGGPARRRAPRRLSQGGRKLLAPVVAAAAVLAVAAAAVAIASHSARPPRPAAGPGPSVVRGIPRYYLELAATGAAPTGGGPLTGPRSAVVRDTRTGARLAVARPPAPYNTFAAAAGAGDDRTFVLAAGRQPPPFGVYGALKLYLARFNPAQRTLRLQPLPIAAFTRQAQLQDFALSPGGTELAVAVRTGLNDSVFQIRLYSLAGQLIKIWQGRGSLIGPYLANGSISWSATGMLAMTWIPKATQGVYVLNTRAAGGSLATDAHLVVPARPQGDPFEVWGSALLSTDGHTIVVPMIRLAGSPPVRGEFQEFSAATGRQIRALWPVHSPMESVLWGNRSASVLVVIANLTSGPKSSSRWAVGVLRGNRFTPIPGVPRPADSVTVEPIF
jgi:hypothetical protein